MRDQKIKITETATQALGAGALAYSYTFLRDGYLDGVEIHFSGACSQTVSVTRDSVDGANYDTVLKSEALSVVTDFTYFPSRKRYFRKGDIIKIGITSGGSTTAYLTALLEEEHTWVK